MERFGSLLLLAVTHLVVAEAAIGGSILWSLNGNAPSAAPAMPSSLPDIPAMTLAGMDSVTLVNARAQIVATFPSKPVTTAHNLALSGYPATAQSSTQGTRVAILGPAIGGQYKNALHYYDVRKGLLWQIPIQCPRFVMSPDGSAIVPLGELRLDAMGTLEPQLSLVDDHGSYHPLTSGMFATSAQYDPTTNSFLALVSTKQFSGGYDQLGLIRISVSPPVAGPVNALGVGMGNFILHSDGTSSVFLNTMTVADDTLGALAESGWSYRAYTSSGVMRSESVWPPNLDYEGNIAHPSRKTVQQGQIISSHSSRVKGLVVYSRSPDNQAGYFDVYKEDSSGVLVPWLSVPLTYIPESPIHLIGATCSDDGSMAAFLYCAVGADTQRVGIIDTASLEWNIVDLNRTKAVTGMVKFQNASHLFVEQGGTCYVVSLP